MRKWRDGVMLGYSPDNRLTGVTGIADYGYNGIGERVLKTDAGGTTLFLYDPLGRLMAELDDTGQVERVYVHFTGRPLAVVDYVSDPAGTLYYIHNDHLGTPQGLTDEAGVLVWQAVYTPFGLAAVDADPDLDTVLVSFNLRFPGQYFDGETGFHYNYHRYYDPGTGRYITSDPIGLTGGLNTFAYVRNNPVSRFDFFGLYCQMHQKTGIINCSRGGETIFIDPDSYSGHGEGVNNPKMEGVPNVGPTPKACYVVGPDKNGWRKLTLLPEAVRPNNFPDTRDPDSFYVHGDSVKFPGQQVASEGCPISNSDTRDKMETGEIFCVE